MPVAVNPAVSRLMMAGIFSGMERKKPGSCNSRSNSGDWMMRASASASNTVDVSTPIRFESGRYERSFIFFILTRAVQACQRMNRYGRITCL